MRAAREAFDKFSDDVLDCFLLPLPMVRSIQAESYLAKLEILERRQNEEGPFVLDASPLLKCGKALLKGHRNWEFPWLRRFIEEFGQGSELTNFYLN